MLKRLARKGGRKILLGWNRGVGDIALGLYAIVERIRELVPNAEITFVTRHNLYDGFSLLEGVKTIIDPHWKRGEVHAINPDLKKRYDLVIENPSPTDWVYWQRGKITPKLKWDPKYDSLYERFNLPENCIGVQVSAETKYGLWRNWPKKRWEEFFSKVKQPVVLFGYEETPKFENVIDLRGKTTLFELLSIVKHRVNTLVLPDSGISSMVYYLNESYPIRHITLWADPDHGILKQAVGSPNDQLIHRPLIAKEKNLANLSVDEVLKAMQKKVLPILLAGGMGTRLGVEGPKGLFEIAGKTLFHWFCDKLPKGTPLAIMTSPLNHEATVSYFQKNSFFGLNVHFFQQEMMPLLDEEKKPIDQLAPNGNGNLFKAFIKAGLDKKFADVECVTISYVDNPLTNPLDKNLITPLADITVQCVEREKGDHSMGVIVENEGKFEVVEYTELDPEKEYRYAYSGQLAMNFSFFCKMGQKDLPIHWVQKEVDGRVLWKGEEFIFDVFKYAKQIFPLCVDRKTHYAPIKGKESVEKALEVLR